MLLGGTNQYFLLNYIANNHMYKRNQPSIALAVRIELVQGSNLRNLFSFNQISCLGFSLK
jgi:hypothetical protein